MITAEFLITSLIVVLSPGTGVIYTISTGILSGRKASLAAAFGCTLGILPHLLASVLGLSAILHTSALAFQLMKYVGAAYLFYLAWQTWRNSQTLVLGPEDRRDKNSQPLSAIARKAVLINILNPKLSIFFLAFLPPFIDGSSATPHIQMATLSGIFILMTFLVFCAYGLGASKVRHFVMESHSLLTILRRSVAACFAFLGLRLAMTRN